MSVNRIDLVKSMYSQVYAIRRFEQVATEQYRVGNIRGYLHTYQGEEAVAVGAIIGLNPDDYIVSTHRGHGHAIAKGHDPRRMLAELFGRETGYCRGRGGSMHVSSLAERNLGANGIVGGGMPIGAGAAMGIKVLGGKQVVVCFFSDGAANNGVFHESLNMAAIYRLPIIYVLENNQYAVSSPAEEMTLVTPLSLRAEGYGIPGLTVDGNDAELVYEAMQGPIGRAREGMGPTLVECITYRRGGHHVNDPGLYMPKEERDYWEAKDPITVLRSRLLGLGVAQAEIDGLEAGVEKTMEEAVQFALESPQPSVEEFLEELPRY